MDTRLKEVFDGAFRENYIHPFLSIFDKDSYSEIEQKINTLYLAGIYSMVLDYHKDGLPMMALYPFDDAWWERLA